MKTMDVRNIVDGSTGEAWVDGEKWAEIKKCNAKVEIKKDEVPIPGTNRTGHKSGSWTGKGSMTVHHVSSRVLKKLAVGVRNGENPVMTIYSKVSNAKGAERVILRYVTFDDLTLIDWTTGEMTERELPFTFEDYDITDTIDDGISVGVNINGVAGSLTV